MATFGNLETDIELLVRLMRDHEETHALAERAQEALEEALADPGAGRPAAVMELVRDLDAYLAEDMVIHIAKEEDILFPALRGFAADLDKVVDEMVEQHDEVRARAAAIESALERLDSAHRDVDAAKAGLAQQVAAAGGDLAPAQLSELLDAVKRLDWILRGHFGDEEDDLFPPAIELLPPATWDDLARQARALDE